MRHFTASEHDQPPLLDPTRERDSRRILRLFQPYKLRLTIVLLMIVSAPPFKMPPPSLDAELPVTVLLVIVSVPPFKMPPATPTSLGGLPFVLWLSLTTLLMMVSVALP